MKTRRTDRCWRVYIAMRLRWARISVARPRRRWTRDGRKMWRRAAQYRDDCFSVAHAAVRRSRLKRHARRR